MKIIIITGPTATGKTSVALKAARQFNGEVVSADSMQIYRGCDIGTAKPTKEETADVFHHMIDICDVQDDFSAADYTRLARSCIKKIWERGKIPIVTGGTGMYIDFLLNNTVPDENKLFSVEKRGKLEKLAETHGKHHLHDLLAEIDPSRAAELHENDSKRIIRALEIYYTTGLTMSEQKPLTKSEKPLYDPLFIGLNCNTRENLYERIEHRVDIMIANGLVDEASWFFASDPCKTAAQAIGYKELKPYLNGESNLETAVNALKTNTRRYAKRQLTWHRKNSDMNWFYVDMGEDYIKNIMNKIGRFIYE